MAPIVFHIGMEKTATTALQNTIFSKHSDINNIFYDDLRLRGLLLTILQCIAFYRESDYAYFLKRHTKDIHAVVHKVRNSDCVTVVSYENLTKEISVDPVLVAQRIKNLFGVVKILLTIREQKSIIVSKYLHMVGKHIFTGNAKKIHHWMQHDLEANNLSYIKLIKFSDIVDIYVQVFGEDNVQILPYELLIHERHMFLRDLSVFLEIDFEETLSVFQPVPINSRISLSAYLFSLGNALLVPEFVRQLVGAITPSLYKTKIRQMLYRTGPPSRVFLPAHLRTMVDRDFAVSNANLQKRCRYDLSALGYTLDGNDD